jgi:hypothetical protein
MSFAEPLCCFRSISKHVLLRKKQTDATSAKAASFQHLKQDKMPPLERVGKDGVGQPAYSWGSEVGVRQLVENAGARLWNMPEDGDCAFHMYTR